MAKGRISDVCGEDGLWPLIWGGYKFIVTMVSSDGGRTFQGFEDRKGALMAYQKHSGPRTIYVITRLKPILDDGR